MTVIDRLPSLDAKALTAIEQNAQRWLNTGTDKQRAEAESVLLAISNERRRRRDDADQDRRRLAAEVAEKVRDKALFDRVLFAFSDMPPEEWEVEVLKEISFKPGRDFDTLAHGIGKRGGGYINLAVGTLCSTREAYLGPAPPVQKAKGQRVYSALLIDFTRHVEANGSEWHGWTLKPDAEAALRQLGIVG
jgi:hypothetical protein